MNRRDAVVALLAMSAAPFAEGQQPGRIPRIGVIGDQGPEDPRIRAFRQGLRDLGYTEGQNILIEYRYMHGLQERVPPIVAELLGLKIDVLAVTGGPVALAAQTQTKTVPIVFNFVADPVGSGLVVSFARPGGNITGVSSLGIDINAKQLELLKAAAPHVSRVAILYNPLSPSGRTGAGQMRKAGQALGLELQFLEVRRPSELADAFTALTAWRAGAVLAISDAMFGNELTQFSTLAAVNRLPAMYNRKEFAEAGGLISYGVNVSENARRAATYVDKILKGAKPADLPVEQPTRIELVINLKTAKAFAIRIPQSLLLRADQVIE